ncbi:fatty-acyl-CoA synthase [Quadrisphaera granulorum]|uniref:Fatty-acyl-CoA synthase n=1 Tax=Quadrisphaera granulorum TaxID=317664 RepID=A0A316AW45_9ACTN|nr:long-chain fatty acid--CoA ligase [Quadrisphaera granulorum]PWJ54357.1 fatty-acyl-CoA synthase [Quadrisphaera granulorum]SZE96129.1 fatty-acyl-CoA synthase [Quadrisphaera granulorum]
MDVSAEAQGIGSWLRLRAVKSKGHPALVFNGAELTYDELADRVDGIAAGLRARGVSRGDRVAYLGDNHPSFVEAMFATARLGAVFVPLNTRLAAPELAYMLADCGASLLISTPALAGRADEAAAGSAQPLVQVRVGADGDDGAGDDFEALLDAPPLTDLPDVGLEDPALIVYTSGTTGRPKGAVLTHGNLTWNALNVLVDYDVTSTDRALMVSPLFHVASLGMGCLPVLLKGATVLLQERFVAAEALASIETLRATTISGVPTTFQLMADDPTWATTDLSSLRLMTCGGSPVPDRVREAYEARGLRFSGGYGMTEASPGITLLPPQHTAAHPRSAGLAHFFTRVRIRDTATGELAGPGVAGEVEALGPNTFLEYWGNPSATADARTRDGWLRTGDVGLLDEDGFLVIADRIKDMIISGAENVYPAEVENALMALPGVTGAAVIGLPHERWGEVPHAVVTLAPGAELTSEAMVERLSVSLARYKVPRTLEVVAELPRTASGKVPKRLLRQRYDRTGAP